LEVSYWDQNPVCFTLDAGANVHVLYPENDSAAVLQFIKDELVGFAKMGSTFVKLKWFKKIELIIIIFTNHFYFKVNLDQLNMKGPLFYSKILLFENGIIRDSKGLSIPL
jgi:hypothetical protein